MSVASNDLKLISGDFLFDDLPLNKEYLRHYFSGDVQKRFLVYYLNFSSMGEPNIKRLVDGFCDHTGISCADQWVYKLVRKIQTIETMAAKAQAEMDLETLSAIKTGQKKL